MLEGGRWGCEEIRNVVAENELPVCGCVCWVGLGISEHRTLVGIVNDRNRFTQSKCLC
jgi:hypothetical protein